MSERPRLDSSTTAEYARLLSLAVHELRTPASVVAGYLRMLQGDTAGRLDDRQLKMVTEAQKSCARIVELINEISEVSKLDAGVAALGAERFDLFRLVADAADRVTEARDRGVTLRVEGESAGAPVSGDVPRVRAAFEAFLRAVLREQPGATTVVASRRLAQNGGSRSAMVVIARESDVDRAGDAGPGPFDEKRGGLGLALPIARRVVEHLGGQVWSPAAGSSDGGRTSLVVSIPLSENSR
jgi:signal transduction histidine kinase